MNVINSYRNVDYPPNIFIGGLGSYVTTKEQMLSYISNYKLNFIKNFKVVDNNISFYASQKFNFKNYAFNLWSGVTVFPGGNIITYFIDLDNKLANISFFCFFQQSNLKFVYANGIVQGGDRGLSALDLRLFYYPNFISSTHSRFVRNNSNLRRIYIPNCTSLFNSGYTEQFNGCSNVIKAVVNPVLLTNNGGNMDGDLQYLVDNFGTEVVGVTDFTPPSSITDLSVTPSTTTATVTFTPPASANAIDFYEVWLEEVGNETPEQKYLPNNQELTASGQTITGLTSGKTYKLRLATCDVFYNGSGMSETPAFSNEIIFTT